MVTLRTEDGDRRTAVGRVSEFSSAGLTLVASTGAVLDYPTGDVIRVVTPRLPAHLAGLRAWSNRQVDVARDELDRALREEPREWVRREILAALVTADLAAADRPAAGAHWLALWRSDPGATDRLGLAPVPWGDRPPRAADLAAANRWATGPDDAEKLLGAGVLVGQPNRRAEAVASLKRLSRSGTPQIAELARLQRWRAKVLDGQSTDGERDAARRRIESLSEALRAGPLFTLGVASAAAGRNDEAIAAFLWAPAADPADPVRAADGLLRAADLLRAGDPLAAVRLWRECESRFPFAEAAETARRRLEEFAPGASGDAAATAVPKAGPAP